MRPLLCTLRFLVAILGTTAPLLEAMVAFLERLRDESFFDADSVLEPEEIAEEIAEDLRGALDQISEILGDLSTRYELLG